MRLMIILDTFGVRLIRGLVSYLFPFSGPDAIRFESCSGWERSGRLKNEERRDSRKDIRERERYKK
jgi:hypothetical protein